MCVRERERSGLYAYIHWNKLMILCTFGFRGKDRDGVNTPWRQL